ncbi:MAG: hypothetical protein EOO45_21170 [Flavobacterium sp.]|nr:MAG: hypothetical protein EOO45_21170 [Flavobacterium sp.]
MFDEILKMVKDQIGGNPQVTSALPTGQEDEVHKEIASHIDNGIKSEAQSQGGVGGLMDSLKNAAGSGSPITSAIEGGLIGSLGSKFGLSPAITGAISAALPGLLQKFAHKANDPNDPSITHDSIQSSLSGGLGGLLGGMFK